MKARMAVLYSPGQSLVIEELEIPPLKAGQALVKVLFSGICGTQLGEVEGKMGPDKYLPHCLGHEGTGIVVNIGEGVTKVSVGDHVILSWIKGSGLNSLPPRYYKGSQEISAGFANTFTEYSTASENHLVPISKDMPLDKAAILGCAVATGFGAVINEAKVNFGSNVLVIGTGGVGFSVIQAASLVNALKIIVIGRNETKLEKARFFGATSAFNLFDRNLESKIKELTNGKGVDFAFEAVGERSTMEKAYELTRNDGGTVVLIGVPRYQESITIDAGAIFQGKRLIGTSGGRSNPDIDFPKYVHLYLSGMLKLDEMITHRFKLHEINAALELLRKGGKVGRAILEF
jgi:S-(hydroxymethyl)glutathione dehydrogenase/alcohol dehydrogenase